MLNRLPKYAGELSELLADIGRPSSASIAKALGVSVRTVERWKKHGAPRTALLSLWWLSRYGHDTWDCEMHNRTVLAISLRESLERRVRDLEKQVLMARSNTEALGRFRHAINDQAFRPRLATAYGLTGASPSPECA